MTKAFAYLRVSGKGQLGGDGFTRQREAIRRYAAANDLKIAHEYREGGVCGATEGMDRPAWVEMIAAIMANGVRTIVIERLDRLARDLMVQEHIIADLQRRGIVLISTAEPDLCSADPTRKLMRQIMGAIAEYDRQMVVLKLRGARQRVRTTVGRCEGRKPFGRDAAERAVIERMRELRAAGLGFDRIAAQLNTEGLKPRSGARWWGRSVNNTLSHSDRRTRHPLQPLAIAAAVPRLN